MNPKKPNFKTGDKIQHYGAPSEVFKVTNLQLNTDSRGNFYTLTAPDGKAREVSIEDVDKTHVKNSLEFNRQHKQLNKESPTPGFDKNGFPTFEGDEYAS